MLMNEVSYQRKTDCFKLDRDNKRERIYCGSQSHKVFDCDNCYNSATTAWEKDTEPFLARVKDHVRIAIQSTILQFAKTEMETQHQR